MRRIAVTVAIGLLVAACGSATATPTGQGSTAPGATPTFTPAGTPTQAPTATPAVTPTLAPTPTPTPTPTATPTASATPSAGGDATTCTDWALDSVEFTKAAKKVGFSAYCAVLPKGWWVSNMSWEQPSGQPGKMIINYKNKKGATLQVSEGNFCGGCAWVDTTDLGAAAFGPLDASLKLRAAGQYALYVTPGAKIQYQITSTGVTQSVFTSIAAAMVMIPKS